MGKVGFECRMFLQIVGGHHHNHLRRERGDKFRTVNTTQRGTYMEHFRREML